MFSVGLDVYKINVQLVGRISSLARANGNTVSANRVTIKQLVNNVIYTRNVSMIDPSKR